MISFLLIFAFSTFSQGIEDHSCMVSTSDGYVFTWKSVACSNVLADSICEDSYYPGPDFDYPREGSIFDRPRKCHTFDPSDGEPVYGDAKTVATLYCPKTCGYCCELPDFKCQNKNVTINCDTITKAECMSPKWRQVLANECPSSCGFCDLHGCLDLVDGCDKDPAICSDTKMIDFVEKNCKRTCGMCPLKISNSVKQEL